MGEGRLEEMNGDKKRIEEWNGSVERKEVGKSSEAAVWVNDSKALVETLKALCQASLVCRRNPEVIRATVYPFRHPLKTTSRILSEVCT